jgi:site-specific DNA-methyltransferase (adenine-specific)
VDKEVMFSSRSGNWATPQDFFDKLNEEFGFTLDPCADDSNHKCEKYYTEEQDGLKQDWSNESVFCNPPYGRDVSKWVKKCFDEVYSGKCRKAVLLLHARTDTRWFHDYIYHRAEVRFVRGRLKFGDMNQPAPFPSMVVIFRGKEVSHGRGQVDKGIHGDVQQQS